MRCLFPRTVSFEADGKTITWSPKKHSKQYASFQLPCSKCIECRLEYARQWAVRSIHEAKMHENNSFITLTYSDEHLLNPKLDYNDFQLFLKRLRWHYPREMPFAATGEYGELNKRPHWHSLIFNFAPEDSKFKYTSDSGEKVYTSEALTKIWGQGNVEYGSVTFQSAGYVMRYAAKKLVHGNDGHEYEPISKKSLKYPLGKAFIEKYHKDIFTRGFVILENGTKCSIPRYYEKWYKKNHPELWQAYVTKIKIPQMQKAEIKEEQHKVTYYEENCEHLARTAKPLIPKNRIREKIITERFKRLQQYLKGDI